MKLDRNLNGDGRGKYGLILNRKLEQIPPSMQNPSANAIRSAIAVLEQAGILDWGDTVDTEFFVIRLRDKIACPALRAYAVAAFDHDPDYAQDIFDLANRSGIHHPNAKVPD